MADRQEFGPRISKLIADAANARTLYGDGAFSMAVKTEHASTNGTKPKAERTAFGKRFHARMANAGFGGAKQIEEALGYAFTYKQIYYLYGADYASIDDATDTVPLLKACATLAGIPLDSFFSDSEPAGKPAVAADLIGMVNRAMTGPKAEFLADAIEMAYAAAVTSRPRAHS